MPIRMVDIQNPGMVGLGEHTLGIRFWHGSSHNRFKLSLECRLWQFNTPRCPWVECTKSPVCVMQKQGGYISLLNVIGMNRIKLIWKDNNQGDVRLTLVCAISHRILAVFISPGCFGCSGLGLPNIFSQTRIAPHCAESVTWEDRDILTKQPRSKKERISYFLRGLYSVVRHRQRYPLLLEPITRTKGNALQGNEGFEVFEHVHKLHATIFQYSKRLEHNLLPGSKPLRCSRVQGDLSE